jgi:HEPN domain-containing protein
MKQHETWLEKALRDLKSAKILFESDDPILDTAIFHTQQCAEKALKAYLVFTGQTIIRTHDLTALNDICARFDSDFDNLYDEIEFLNPYSTMFRYPGDIINPDTNEVEEAINNAEKVLAFVNKKINK